MGISDHKNVNFSEKHEMDYHLDLVNKSQSKDNRAYLVNNTQWTAKDKLEKTIITHDEFKPFVEADKNNLDDPS